MLLSYFFKKKKKKCNHILLVYPKHLHEREINYLTSAIINRFLLHKTEVISHIVYFPSEMFNISFFIKS